MKHLLLALLGLFMHSKSANALIVYKFPIMADGKHITTMKVPVKRTTDLTRVDMPGVEVTIPKDWRMESAAGDQKTAMWSFTAKPADASSKRADFKIERLMNASDFERTREVVKGSKFTETENDGVKMIEYYLGDSTAKKSPGTVNIAAPQNLLITIRVAKAKGIAYRITTNETGDPANAELEQIVKSLKFR
jgi:hypothetical protein